MSDVLIRDVPDDVLAALEAHAARLGPSRNEYRRRLLQGRPAVHATVTMADQGWFSETSSDLADPDVVDQAGR